MVKSAKQMALDAVLIAMFVVLSLFSIETGNLRISFDALPIIIGGLLFGPVDGLIIGTLGSFLQQMLSYGFTATTVLWMLPAMVRGLMIGLYAKQRRYDFTRRNILFITIISSLIVTTVTTLVMYADSKVYGYYSFAYIFGTLFFRYILGVATAMVYSAIMPTLLKTVKKYYLRITAPAD